MRTDVFLTILAMAVATFLTRFASPAILGSTGVPTWLQRILKHVPTAMLTALIAPALVAPQGYLDLALENHYLVAGIAATLAAYWRQPPIVTMGTGMAVMLLLRTVTS